MIVNSKYSKYTLPVLHFGSYEQNCPTSYLIEKGHQNILGIFGSPNLKISQERIYGYEKAMNEKGLQILKENIISVSKSTDLDFILPQIFKHNKKIDAVFTMSDELLAKTLYHIKGLGLSIPRDVSIISISDEIYPYLTHPQISHMKGSGTKMGRNACKILFDAIADSSKTPGSTHLVSTKLVELESV